MELSNLTTYNNRDNESILLTEGAALSELDRYVVDNLGIPQERAEEINGIMLVDALRMVVCLQMPRRQVSCDSDSDFQQVQTKSSRP